MLKTILKRLNGHAAEAPSLGEALAQLRRDRVDTEAQIVALNAERRQLLLDDASDAQLDKVERQIDRATAQLEKINLAEPPLRERLAAATAAERARVWAAHLAEYRRLAGEFVADARLMAAKHAAVVRLRESIRQAGFESEAARALPFTPNVVGNLICDLRLLEAFERQLKPEDRPPGRAPDQSRAVRHYRGRDGISVFGEPAATRPRPRAAPSSHSHSVSIDVFSGQEIGRDSRHEHAPPLPDDNAPLEEGEARCRVLRGGYEAGDGQSQVGRVIRLKQDVAHKAAAAGAVTIISDFSAE